MEERKVVYRLPLYPLRALFFALLNRFIRFFVCLSFRFCVLYTSQALA